MKKIILLISLNVFVITYIYSQELIGKSRSFIRTNIESQGGVKLDTVFTEKDTSDVYYIEIPNIMTEVFYFNSDDIAYSILEYIYDTKLMMQYIKKFNKEYIENGELTWTYYLRDMKLSVNIFPNSNDKFFNIFYYNPKLDDTYLFESLFEDVNNDSVTMDDNKNDSLLLEVNTLLDDLEDSDKEAESYDIVTPNESVINYIHDKDLIINKSGVYIVPSGKIWCIKYADGVNPDQNLSDIGTLTIECGAFLDIDKCYNHDCYIAENFMTGEKYKLNKKQSVLYYVNSYSNMYVKENHKIVYKQGNLNEKLVIEQFSIVKQ